MKKDLTKGPVTKTMLYFAAPMILGNLLQQGYNIVDALIVGRFLGADALAAVGSAYSLMTFLNAIMIGLCMGSGTIFSVCFGKQDKQQLKNYVAVSFLWIAAVTILLNVVSLLGIDGILHALKVPSALYGMMRDYVWVIFFGIFFTFLYNYFAFLLRALGNSVVPLCFLGAAAGGNILLDIVFVVIWEQGIRGAAWATVLSQAGAGIGIGIYVCCKERSFFPKRKELTCNWKTLLQVMRHASAACVQQSVMNFGILMIQGLVNSFGASVMAAFAAAVKIDSFAYMPAQEFSNAFSLFIAQNYGSHKRKRMQEGIRKAGMLSILFCLLVSGIIFGLAPYLMQIFVDGTETEILAIGTQYLRIEGSFYVGIGILFLLYGYYRGVEKPELSLLLTILSLGTRVLLAYLLAPIDRIGVLGIWWAIPIGWILADSVGLLYLKKLNQREKQSFT